MMRVYVDHDHDLGSFSFTFFQHDALVGSADIIRHLPITVKAPAYEVYKDYDRAV